MQLWSVCVDKRRSVATALDTIPYRTVPIRCPGVSAGRKETCTEFPSVAPKNSAVIVVSDFKINIEAQHSKTLLSLWNCLGKH